VLIWVFFGRDRRFFRFFGVVFFVRLRRSPFLNWHYYLKLKKLKSYERRDVIIKKSEKILKLKQRKKYPYL
jgi:hypothetical protein